MNVRTHYDKRRPRFNDHMLPVRKLHNFAKMCLIKACGQQQRVLDLCCGNGGDVQKLKSIGCAEYIGIDISEGAAERATCRLRESNMQGDVFVGDCFGDEVFQILSGLRAFGLVNCQFALHYAFFSEDCVRKAFRNIAQSLMPGGVLVGTVADGDKLDRLRGALGKKFGDRYYKVAFASKEASDFGDAYAFTFSGAVDNLTEYATRKSVFSALAAEAGLEVRVWENMSLFVQRMMHEESRMFHSMDCDERIPDVTGMYAVFLCVKRDVGV